VFVKLNLTAACVMLTFLGQPCKAQTAPLPYVSVPYAKKAPIAIFSDAPSVDSGFAAAPSLPGTSLAGVESLEELDRDSNYVTIEEVGEEGGDWSIVKFDSFNLGDNSTVTVKSIDSNESQVFDQEYLEQSGGYTPMFAGGKLTIQLNKAKEDENVFYIIDEVLVGVPPTQRNAVEGFPPTSEQMVEPIEAQCGSEDNRQMAQESSIGRIMPVGCTAWNIADNLHLTAGHCMRGNRMLQLQVNVPLSSNAGLPGVPAVEDQFVIIQNSIQGKDKGIGEDFAVFRTLPNSVGKTAHELHGHIEMASISGVPSVEIIGFGLDDEPAGDPPTFRNQFSQTEQTHEGPLGQVSGTIIRHKVDTRGGNSGAPVLLTGIRPLTAIGIHTHGGCEDQIDSFNHGTTLEHPELQALIPHGG
jgi:Trypsin